MPGKYNAKLSFDFKHTNREFLIVGKKGWADVCIIYDGNINIILLLNFRKKYLNMNCLYLEINKNCNIRFGGLLKLIHEVLNHTVFVVLVLLVICTCMN